MSPKYDIPQSKLDRFISSLRLPIIVLSFVWIVYVSSSLQALPDETFSVLWQPDIQLQIAGMMDNSPVRSFVQVGDIILAVDGVPVERTKPVFTDQKSSYELTIQRRGQTLNVTIPFPSTPPSLGTGNFPLIALSLVLWGSATALFFLSMPQNLDGLRTGGIFLLWGIWVISYGGALTGVLGAWIPGHSLTFLIGVSAAYLGFLFDTTPNLQVDRLFKYVFLVAMGMGVIGLLEVVFLYPTSSIEELTGISWLTIGKLSIVIGLILHFLILITRRIKTKQVHLRRQLNILLLFISVGTLPATIVLLFPNSPARIPLEISFAFLLLIPAGYIFVINRINYLLDKMFIQLITSCILALTAIISYSGVLFLVEQLAETPQTISTFSLGLGIPVVWLIVKSRYTLRNYTEQIVYGKQVIDEKVIEKFTFALTTHPDLETLQGILKQTAQGMNINQAVILLFRPDKETLYLSNDNPDSKTSLSEIGLVLNELSEIKKTILRASSKTEPIFRHLVWAEAIIPLQIRGEQIGIFIVSRPTDEPFLNEKQITLLSLVAGVISVGYDTITLLESSLELSNQLLHIRDTERKTLAAQIHDDPLQKILVIIDLLERSNKETNQPATTQGLFMLREVDKTLRQICIGLRPPILEQGLEAALKAVVHKFRQDHPNYHLEINIEENDILTANEDVITAVYYIVIEALNNIVKHTMASNVQVSLKYDDNQARVAVQDNGQGNEQLHLSTSELLRQGHLGILGMREWAKKANSRLSFENTSTGMTVLLEVPVFIST